MEMGNKRRGASKSNPRKKSTGTCHRKEAALKVTSHAGGSQTKKGSPSRTTNQRQCIQGAIEQANRPLNPQEILAKAQKNHPGLGIATVYRAINHLIEEGWLVSIPVAGESTRYERAGMDHHHHFHCHRCHKYFDLMGCPKGITALIPPGFIAENHELTITGVCETCALRQSKRPRPKDT